MQEIKKFFNALDIGKTEQDGLFNVALMTVGPALNHYSDVDDKTLQSVIDCVAAKPLKSYDSHYSGDDVASILGFFTGLKIVGDKVVAEKFAFRPSADAKSKTAILECAEIAPQSMGVSLSGTVNLVWLLDDGKEQDYYDTRSRPDNAVGENPRIRFVQVYSADFVGTPAANPDGLFNAKNQKKERETGDMANKKLAYFTAKYADNPAKLARAVIKLSADEEKPEAEIEKEVEGESELEELKAKLAACEAENKELKDKLAALEAEKAEGDKKLDEANKALSALKGASHFDVGNAGGASEQRQLATFESQYSALIAEGKTAEAAALARKFVK